MRVHSYITCFAAAVWGVAAADQAPMILHDEKTDSSKKELAGIGFSLSDGYGVASAFFSNGTSVDVAKIQGGFHFKQYMSMTGGLEELPQTPRAPNCTLPQIFCDHWPGKTRTQTKSPLYPMLSALKMATEAALEEPLSVVQVSFPRYPSTPNNHDILNEELKLALSQASLQTWRPALYNNEYAAKVHGLFGKCADGYDAPSPGVKDDPLRIIFTAEHTREALTVVLQSEECGVYEPIRESYSRNLGQDALDKCRASSPAESCYSELYENFAHMVRLPIRHADMVFDHIDAVVTLGESAQDRKMHETLKKALSDNHHGVEIATSPDPAGDPTFSASLGVAQYDWSMKNRYGH
ncbi:hypothetical protein B9Z65_4162 [Elsinoe australis]|uniref:Uncharacterized protein n=1 Tax=Elsinoe australis TaxID=40998 RepID=A0A2P7Z215_9PEZI|nr:hypothetical protein B9Z65_4162 [Elsinoe australis]